MEIKRTVLVPYAAPDMFDLIERAEHYPQFIPWCVSATILERSPEWVAARIDFNYRRFRFGFATRNPKQRPDWLHVRLVEGPFKQFQGDWALTPLGAQGCRVDFHLRYEISEGIVDRMAGTAVEVVTRSMVDAFVRRAEATLTVLAPAQSPAPPADQTPLAQAATAAEIPPLPRPP